MSSDKKGMYEAVGCFFWVLTLAAILATCKYLC